MKLMCKNCNNCNGFIPKSEKQPCNAFDSIAGNVVGVCNFTENVMPLYDVILNCKMWKSNEAKEIISKGE